jgi:cytochrome c553
MMVSIRQILKVAIVLLVPASVLASQPTWDTCDECHGTDGMGQGDPTVPVVAGIPAGHIEEAIFAYVDGIRRCVEEPCMCETVEALSESEVAEVAEYYGGMERGSSDEEFDKGLAAEGAVLHQNHCSICHLPPEHKDVAYAIGIPLHGQDKMQELEAGDLDALINYYASYRSTD